MFANIVLTPGASLQELWEFASQKQGEVDDFQRKIIWQWLNLDPEIILASQYQPLGESETAQGLDYLVETYGEKLQILASEEKQWLTLTGRPKEGNPIGSFAFELLSAISRARERGLTAIELSKMTGQDPRSLHGRVLALVEAGLVQKIPVVRGGAHTNLVVMKRFRNEQQPLDESSRYGLQQVKRAIVNATKVARNGLREVEDLKMELELTKNRRGNVIFNNATRILQAGGYVTRVIVFRSDNENKKYKCIKFLKDMTDQTEEEDSEEDDEDMFDDLDDNMVVKENTTKGQHQIQPGPDLGDSSELIKMEDDFSTTVDTVLFNSFYPLENQVYDLVASSGVEGMPAMDVCKRLVGRAFNRNVSRLLTDVSNQPADGRKKTAKSSSAASPHLDHLAIIRGIDFSARMKFYRYFTHPNYNRFSHEPLDPIWGTYKQPDLKGHCKTLQHLNAKSYIPLPGSMEILQKSDGTMVPYFHGDKGKASMVSGKFVTMAQAVVPPGSTPSSSKKRGRPRKRPLTDDESSPPAAKRKPSGKRGRPRKQSLLNDSVTETQAYEISARVPRKTRGQSKRLAVYGEENDQDKPMYDVSKDVIDLESQMPLEQDAAAALSQAGVIPAIDPAASNGFADVNGHDHPPAESSPLPIVQSPIVENTEAAVEKIPRIAPVKRAKYSMRGSLSFAEMKRQNQLLELLKENDGVIEGGVMLLRRFNQRFSGEMGSQIDRKTVEKSVNRLCDEGALYKYSFEVPTTQFIRYLIVDSAIDSDSPSVQELKQLVIEGIRTKADPTQEWSQVAHEHVDFQYYMKTPAIPAASSKAVERLQSQSRARKEKKEKKVAKEKASASQPIDIPIDIELQCQPINHEPSSNKVMPVKRGRVTEVKKEADASLDSKRTPKRGKRKTSILSKLVPTDDIYDHDQVKGDFSSASEAASSKEVKRNPLASGTRKRNTVKKADLVDNDLFFRVVIITRSLFFASGVINWDKVVETLPQYSLKIAKSKWPRVRDKYGNTRGVNLATKRWESFFLRHYENGDLPAIDNFYDFDVLFYAEYWRTHDKDLAQTNTPWLSETRAETMEQYNFYENERASVLEAFYNSPSMIKTDELLSNFPFGYSAYENEHENDDSSSDIVARAQRTIKAIIATDNEVYDPKIAERYLTAFGEQTCAEAVSQLENERSVIYVPKDKEKVRPGRNYIFSEKVHSLLQSRLGNKVLDEASIFERGLVDAIQASKGFIMSRTAPDSSLVSILDLVCHRQIDLVRVNTQEKNVLVGYKSRAIDKDKLDCDIVLRGRASVDVGHMTRPVVKEPLSQEPLGNIWTNVAGGLSVDLWRRIICALLLIIALRPGIRPSYIRQKYKLVLTYSEVLMVLDWLEARQSIYKGECDGYFIKARWYSNVY